jgi:NAD(P)-dependent dehydrogenase (short-subunit alcohol dehydrogenase family)
VSTGTGRRSLDGRVAIVTGAAGGIGAAYARHLGELGATVVIADRDGPGAKAQAELLTDQGLRCWGAEVDISDAAATSALAQQVVERDGAIDVLVNNAAIYRGVEMLPAEDIDLVAWHRIFDVNVNGTFHMCRAVIPHMRRQGFGKIVNQSSVGAHLAPPNGLPYCTTKAAVITMTKVLAKELGEDNINVNAIAPGVINTQATMDTIPEMMQEMLVLNAAIKRVGTPDDLLGVLELLCTSAGDYITGQTIIVDGGVFMLG